MESQQMGSKKVVNFISGHLDITQAGFEMPYRPLIDRAITHNECFVVGELSF